MTSNCVQNTDANEDRSKKNYKLQIQSLFLRFYKKRRLRSAANVRLCWRGRVHYWGFGVKP